MNAKQQQEFNKLIENQKKLIAEQCKMAAQNKILAHENLLRVQAHCKEMAEMMQKIKPINQVPVSIDWVDGLIDSL